jgi:hypothetical protein
MASAAGGASWPTTRKTTSTQIVVVYEGRRPHDPSDHDELSCRRHAELIPDGTDALLVWREVVGDLDAMATPTFTFWAWALWRTSRSRTWKRR